MDPFSHVVLGRTLIALDRRGRFGPGAGAASVLGALAPDIDAIAIWKGWDVYLRVHEIGTHSIPGSFAVACAAATLLYSLKRGGRYGSLMLAAWIGALSHVGFDLISGATIKIGWPISEARARVPLVAMADPWVIAICLTGAVALWISRRRKGAAAGATVAAIVGFLALKGTLMAIALPQWAAATSPDTIVHHTVEASWSSLTRWDVFDRTPHALRQWRVDAIADRATLLTSYPVQPEPPIVASSKALDTVRNFLHTHQLGFAVVTTADNGDTQVLWSDIRYCWDTAGITAEDDGTPFACAVWFGGAFNREGRAVTQIVRVGRWLRVRPARP